MLALGDGKQSLLTPSGTCCKCIYNDNEKGKWRIGLNGGIHYIHLIYFLVLEYRRVHNLGRFVGRDEKRTYISPVLASGSNV